MDLTFIGYGILVPLFLLDVPQSFSYQLILIKFEQEIGEKILHPTICRTLRFASRIFDDVILKPFLA